MNNLEFSLTVKIDTSQGILFFRFCIICFIRHLILIQIWSNSAIANSYNILISLTHVSVLRMISFYDSDKVFALYS